MNTVAIIAPQSNLDTTTEIMRSITGLTVQLCDGNVDRSKVEMFLRGLEADIVHFMGHGDLDVTILSDGALTADELANLLRQVRGLKVVVLTACNSAGTGAEIHNLLHIPTVVMQAPIKDLAAPVFSAAFYRGWRSSSGDVQRAYSSAVGALRQRFVDQAVVPILINGDMATDGELSECMAYVKTELSGVRADLRHLAGEIQTMKARPNGVNWMMAGLLLLLLLAQVGTLLINASRFP